MFQIIIPFMDSNLLYESGQVPTWIRVEESKYVIPHGDKAFALIQKEDRNKLAKYKTQAEKKFNYIMTVDEDRFWKDIYEYFDLSTPYDKLYSKYKRMSEKVKILCNRGWGIRVLKQPLWEVIIHYVCFFGLSPEDTRNAIRDLYKVSGKKHKQGLRDLGCVTWYEVPTPEQILKRENELSPFRKKNVIKLCTAITSGVFNIDELSKMNYEEAKNYMKETLHLHDEQIECICLYGLHFIEAFPIDKDIKRFMEKEFDVSTKEELCEKVLKNEDKELGQLYSVYRYNKDNPPVRIEAYDRL